MISIGQVNLLELALVIDPKSIRVVLQTQLKLLLLQKNRPQVALPHCLMFEIFLWKVYFVELYRFLIVFLMVVTVCQFESDISEFSFFVSFDVVVGSVLIVESFFVDVFVYFNGCIVVP